MPVGRLKILSYLAKFLALLAVGAAELAAAALCLFVMIQPAASQVLDERFPFLEDRARRNRQLWQQQPWGAGYPDQARQAPADSSRAPAPQRKPDVAPSVNVVVFGDSLADWLAYGLEDAFSETPEIGIIRKNRPNTGLIRVETRGESYDWPQSAREMLAAEKPDFVVMMLGLSDRRGIRERTPAAPQAQQQQRGQAQRAGQPAQQQQGGQQQAAQQPATPAQPTDAEASPRDRAEPRPADNEASVIAPETPGGPGLVHEFRSEKWTEFYSRRIDEMIGVLKAKGVPVFWVGLPSIRGSRATSDVVFLNDLFRGRAEKAGITYIDVWDGFVDDSGNYNQYGPDFEGQIRRLRAGDGVHFTRAGSRKLAHYVEREVRRVMLARATPLAAPVQQEPEPEIKAAPGQPAKPAASPVMSLTAPPNQGEALLGGAPSRNAAGDSAVTRVLVKGEAVEAPAGRADDFAWPRRDVVTASGVLPPDPVLPPTPSPAAAAAVATAAPAGAPARPATPRPPRDRSQENSGWRPFAQQRPAEPSRWSPPSFFGSLFGFGR